MAIVRVGLDKQFLYISDAYEYSSSGDTVFIDEGVYIEKLYFDNKVVNLVANSDFPAEGNVSIYFNGISTASIKYYEFPLQIKYVDPLVPTTMLIEGIKFESSPNGQEVGLIRLCQEVNDTSSLNLVFNKCILDASNGLDGVLHSTVGDVIIQEQSSGYPVNNITFSNCEIVWNSTDNFVNTDFDLIPTKSISKTILSDYTGTEIFGFSVNACISGTATVSSGIDQSNAFDGSLISYATLYDPPSWIGYQFINPKVINKLKIKGTSTGHDCEGFTLKASVTGTFSGEEVVLYVNTTSFSSDWVTYEFENDTAFSYIRIYSSNVAGFWAIAVIELYEFMFDNRDFLVTPHSFYDYGPKYSQFTTTIQPTHCFSGIVSVNDVDIQRQIKFFRKDNNVYLGSTMSSGIGGSYCMETSFGGYHTLICLDDTVLSDYNDLIMSKCIPKALSNIYVPYETLPVLTKSVILDIADNWGSIFSYTSIRAIEFYDENGQLITLAITDFVAYATSTSSTSYQSENIFNTSLSKIGIAALNSWMSDVMADSCQRVICVFNVERRISRVVVTNANEVGQVSSAETGIKNTKIHISTDTIVDTTYDVPISNSTLIYDDVVNIHGGAPNDVPDEHILYTPVLRVPI